MGQKSILRASFHSCCDPVRLCGDTSLFPPQASLPVRELLWPVPVHPPETSPELPRETQHRGTCSPATLVLRPQHAALLLLCSAWQEHHERGLCPLTPPFLNGDPMRLRSLLSELQWPRGFRPCPCPARCQPLCTRAATAAKDASFRCSAWVRMPIAALAEVLNCSNSNSLGFITPLAMRVRQIYEA